MDTVHALVVPKLYTTSCQQGCSLIHTQTRNHKEKTDQDVTQSHPLHRTCFSRYQASSAVLGNHGNWEMLSHVILVSNLYTASCQQGCSLIHTQTRNHVLTKMMHKVTHCKGHVSANTRPHQLCWGTMVTGRYSLML